MIPSNSSCGDQGSQKMFKKWRRSLAVALLLGCAANAALAEKLTVAGPAKSTASSSSAMDAVNQTLMQAGFPPPSLDDGPTDFKLTSASTVEGPLLSGSMEQLPMPGTVVDGPPLFETEEVSDNSVLQGIFVGAGLHILRPVIGNNQALVTTTMAPPAAPAFSTTSFSWDFSASPSIVVGYSTPSGLGVAINWFRFDQFSRPRNAIEQPLDGATFSSISGFLSDGTVVAPAAGQTNVFDLSNYLVLDIWDLEMTQAFTVGPMEISAGAGVRYLHMAQRFLGSVTQTGLASGEVMSAFESTANSFSGIGPTLLADVKRPVGLFNLCLYASARAGLLFGSRHESNFTATAFNPGGGADTVVTHGSPDTLRTDQTVCFGELELGVEWVGQYGRFLPVARLGFEAREFLNTGNAQSIFLTDGSDVGLYGIALQAGVGF